MVETDWRQILSFSQRELNEGDKEELCESLSWMEADDIELNFSDLKTLFRLAQDILKYKTEQANNLLGQIETQKKRDKKKSRVPLEDSPTRSSDSVFETIAHQEEIIKANKDILAQLYSDIAEMEGRKNKNEKDHDIESESSRDALSEMNAIEQLEKEATMKNRHIRKLLSDVKNLEEENSQLKEKTSILKDKLTEATHIIENLTEQLFSFNSEVSKLKEALGKAAVSKANLSVEIEKLQKELSDKDIDRGSAFEEVRSKVQHWKNIARSKKAENEALAEEIKSLKNDFNRETEKSPIEMISSIPEGQLKELQNKLKEATNEMLQSAEVIEHLKAENRHLKTTLNDTEAPDTFPLDTKNESDDGKERILINRLKKRVNTLTVALQAAEESVSTREEELAIVTSQLQLLESGEEGLGALLQSLKSKKRQLRLKDEGIKSLVQDVNSLNELNDNLHLENETMREKLNIPRSARISTKGVLKKYQDLEQKAVELQKELRRLESTNLTTELEKRSITKKISHLTRHLHDIGYDDGKIEEICDSNDSDSDNMPTDGGGEGSTFMTRKHTTPTKVEQETKRNQEEIQTIIDENEGLRKGLREVLDFLKDNSNSSSGVLALQCPSLEAVLNSMEARHSAGWVAPHMSALMELKAALGGRDALLTALHEARKETFAVMNQLAKESEKVEQYERKLYDIEKSPQQQETTTYEGLSIFDSDEIGTWMSRQNLNSVDVSNRSDIEDYLANGKLHYENQLRNSLAYFHAKFSVLYDKMTALALQSDSERNKWSLDEEKYKAEIENMKILLSQKEDDDISDDSPGIINYPSTNALQRKCAYLEASYKYVRTQAENTKNEYLESKKEILLITAEYELKIQRLIIYISSITDKLRNCVGIELFWKQNEVLTEMTLNYRKLLNGKLRDHVQPNLIEYFEKDKLEIIDQFRNNIPNTNADEYGHRTLLSNVEQVVLQKQVENLCRNLEETCTKLKSAELKILEYQEAQSKIIDDTLAKTTNDEIDVVKEQLEKLVKDNKLLSDQSHHMCNQLDIALLQLRDSQQRQMSNDIEINMLRHQILDLQSSGDNKAIISRLSSEMLVAHLQASEMANRIDRLNSALNKEVQRRIKAEEMLKAREKIFDVYAHRYASKFRFMFEVMQILRQQYQGCLPLISVENYLNCIENQYRKSHEVAEKLNEIEDLQSNLLIKHKTFDQILNKANLNCLEDEDECQHKIQLLVMQGFNTREIDFYKKKIQTLEQSRDEITRHCNKLEKSLVLVNQGFGKPSVNDVIDIKIPEIYNPNLELEDFQSDEELSRNSITITLPKPQLLKSPKNSIDMTNLKKDNGGFELPSSPGKGESKDQKKVKEIETVNAFVQTATHEKMKRNRLIQTETDEDIKEIGDMRKRMNILQKDYEKNNRNLADAMILTQQKTKENSILTSEKINLENVVTSLKEFNSQKDKIIIKLQETITRLNEELREYQLKETEGKNKDIVMEESRSLLVTIKNLENDKNTVIDEYKEMLKNEREEYMQSVRDFNKKIIQLKSQLEEKGCEQSNTDTMKEVTSIYSEKIVELEDKCFRLQSKLDSCKTDISSYQTEAERWKDLASERLSKMEQLNSQLEERHCQEVQSYKAESQHWLTQLNEGQREHLELRSKLTQQKTLQVKLLAEKDSVIEHLRSVVQNLKVQLMNMQTMMSAHDPSFDMSAIVEVEDSDGASHGSERLEIRFDSSTELRDDSAPGIPSSSTAIWHEPIIERLRREKQFTVKQNSILRKQIKALAARERRARLEMQNLKNQVYRISTSGSKAVTAESASLQTKIVALQAQLSSARRDSHSSVALWDKWKRAQQASERWQAKFEERCREVLKAESSLNLAKSAITRLEKEKRVLLSRLSEVTIDKHTEKQEHEPPEKLICESPDSEMAYSRLPPHISTQSLLDRVEAQQRRIAALEMSERGNESLVSEYERCLAENTALKGQVLKLESTLLEVQMRTPLKTSDPQPELNYWKSYCDMLKEENIQLSVRLSSAEAAPAHPHQHQRVNDLEQTVLTLRGLVSKLQSEQKSSVGLKRFDASSRPGSGQSFGDKGRGQLESYRTELANLKRSMLDKDSLLERSKEMLKIAAEREDELLRENAYLCRQLNELKKPKDGCLSA